MKKTILYTVCLAVLTMTGCDKTVLEFPENGGIDPTLVNVNLTLAIDPKIESYEPSERSKVSEAYLHDVEICQQFARRNREKMAEILLERTGLTGTDAFHTIHNYIDTNEMILRKGAIAAHKGERVLIPINMRDGSILAVGKGNPEWNDSAPHGAGRLMSRKKAKETLALEEYRKSMEGIYTTSVNEHTLDEAPMAYKSLDDILDIVRASVDVVEVLRPVYNFKASE